MKLVRIATLAVLGLMAVAIVCGLLMPRVWKVERSIVVQAPPEKVMPWIEDPKRWPEWLPWTKEKDATIAFTFSGAARGRGAVLEWRGEQFPHATLTITKCDPATGVAYDLVFEGSEFPSHGALELSRQGDATKVTWRDGGDLGVHPMHRLLRGMIEQNLAECFDEGLAKLEQKVESTRSP